MKYLALVLLFVAPIIAPCASPSIEIMVNPPRSAVSEAFKVNVSLKGILCDKVKDFIVPLPGSWTRLKETRVEINGGCLYTAIVYAKEAGEFSVQGVRAVAADGEIVAKPETIQIIPAKASAPAKPEKATDLSGSKEWISYFKAMLANYLSDQPSSELTGFTIESCRPPTQKFVQMMLKQISSYTHRYQFNDGCDLDGTVIFKVNSPFTMDLKIRNLAGMERFKAQTTIKASVDLTMKLTQVTEIQDGVAYEAGGKVLGRFSAHHTRLLAFSPATLKVDNLENAGTVDVTEFRGKPVKIHEKLKFENMDIRRTKAR